MASFTATEARPLLHAALAASLAGSRAILEVRARGFDVHYKDDSSPLTEADLAAHHAIMACLAPTGLPVLSEESAEVPHGMRAGWRRFWLVDPLDGTKEFVKDNGEFTVNVALIEEGRPVLGVVQAPILDAIYWGFTANDAAEAWKATGCRDASPDELAGGAEALRIDPAARREPPLRVVASRSHCNEPTLRFIEQLEQEHGTVERVSRGSSLKLCLIAEGSASIYPRIAPTMEWDTGAAHAVIAAAGGGVWAYDPELPASAYLDAREGAEGISPLRYNKDDLYNPFFVAC